MFGMAEAVKRDLAVSRQQSVYNRLRETKSLGVKSFTKAEFDAIYFADRSVNGLEETFYIVRLPSSSPILSNLIGSKHVIYRYGHPVLSNIGVEVQSRLYQAFKGQSFCPSKDQKSPANKPKAQAVTVYDPNRLSPLQTVIKSLRTSWATRPRITRFTLRSWRYRWTLWKLGTVPDVPMIDWSGFQMPGWSDADRQEQREAWHRSDLLAFWLCPDGIDAGIEAHDKFLKTCKDLIIEGESAKKILISKITGVPIPTFTPEPPPIPKPVPQYMAKPNHYKDELLEVFDFSVNEKIKTTKPKPVLTPCGCDTKVIRVEKSHRVKCGNCGSTWIPASNNIRVIASDEPNSLERPAKKYRSSKEKYYLSTESTKSAYEWKYY